MILLDQIADRTNHRQRIIQSSLIKTTIGTMLVIADDDGVFLLEFSDKKWLDNQITKLQRNLNIAIVPGNNHTIDFITYELELYFAGRLKEFKTNLHFLGTSFQNMVWRELIGIPYGKTRSYADLAKLIKMDRACRAVANANAANQLVIIVPCHRIINSDGNIGGYSGGVARKEWLINHEKKIFN